MDVVSIARVLHDTDDQNSEYTVGICFEANSKPSLDRFL